MGGWAVGSTPVPHFQVLWDPQLQSSQQPREAKYCGREGVRADTFRECGGGHHESNMYALHVHVLTDEKTLLAFLVPRPLLRCPHPEREESGPNESLVAWLGLGCAGRAVGEHPFPFPASFDDSTCLPLEREGGGPTLLALLQLLGSQPLPSLESPALCGEGNQSPGRGAPPQGTQLRAQPRCWAAMAHGSPGNTSQLVSHLR